MLSQQQIAVVALAFASTAYAGCLADLQAVRSAAVSLDGKVNALSTTSCSATFNPIVSSNTALQNAIDTAKNNANAASSISVADATACYNYLCTGDLWTSSNTLINDVITAYPKAQTCGLVSTSKTLLTNDKTKIDALADAYIAKAPTSDLKSKGTTCKGNYDTLLNKAITKYSS